MALTYSSVLDYTNGNWNALNPKSLWNYYTPIRAVNYYLKNAKDLDFYDLRFTEDYEAQMNRFKRYQYEVRLLRAYYYFQLVRAYGDVPFTTSVLTEAEANSLKRTPASEIFDFIVSECDAVAPELPIDYSKLENDAAGNSEKPETGRVTQGTALALKARALLYRASKLFNESENKEFYKEAAKANLDVINYCSKNGITLPAHGARAAMIAGCIGTSNVLAGKLFDVPVKGTHAHSWIMSFPDELTAFRAYAKLYPSACILLADTYDTLGSGVPNAIRVFQEMRDAGIPLTFYGIRLDSGDLAYISKKARKMLDDAGFPDAVISASNDLDEYLIDSLKIQGAAITSWGVGTNLITSKDCPSFGGVYKLAAIMDRHTGKFIPKIKLS